MKKKGICFAIIMCVLSGCAKAPEVKEEQGINYAVNEKDKNISNIIEEDTESENTYLVEGKEGTKCVCSLGDSGNVINIDAVVTGLNERTISHKKAEPFPDIINKEKVIDIFFGGEENVVENNIQEGDNTEQDNTGEEFITKQMKIEGKMSLNSVDGNISFLQSDGGVYYHNYKLIGQYKQVETEEEFFQEENRDISEAYTADMAKQDLLEVFSEIIDEEIQIISCTAIYNGAEGGNYEIIFAPMIEDVPLAINDWDTNTDSIVDVLGKAEIGQDGISFIEANNFLWKDSGILGETEENCISLEKALVILEEYLRKGDILGAEGITFTRVSLSWLPVTDNWIEAELKPVWRFYIPCAELIETGMAEISMQENVPTDICINAIDGKIENMR